MPKTIEIELTDKLCSLGDAYAKKHATAPPKIGLICCEGACLRGEIARQAANLIAHKLEPEKTVRICLGGLLETVSGMKNLVERANKVLVVEGCFLACASRITAGAVQHSRPTVIIADKLYDFNRQLFGVDEMPADEIKTHAYEVANKIVERFIEK